MMTQSVLFFVDYEIQEKINQIEIKAICERVYMRLSFPFKYCLDLKMIPANMGARQVQDYYMWLDAVCDESVHFSFCHSTQPTAKRKFALVLKIWAFVALETLWWWLRHMSWNVLVDTIRGKKEKEMLFND